MILSVILFALGVFCYSIKELQSHEKLKWQKDDTGFWGAKSWKRKWKRVEGFGKEIVATNTERFPLSSTALVWLTDGYHLMQFIYIKLFVASIILYVPMYSWWVDGLLYLGCWYFFFNVTYKVLSK